MTNKWWESALGGGLMRPDSDQSCTVQVLQRSTLMDLPTLPYRSVTDLAHTLVHSISISGPDLGRPAYLYRFSRDIPILALNHDFPISCGGVPILKMREFLGLSDFDLFCFRRYSRILPAFCTYRQSRRCVAAINSPPYAMNQC